MIDYETLMNDKKLLREELEEAKAHCQALNILNQALLDELGSAYQQVYDLTDEVMRLTEIVERTMQQ